MNNINREKYSEIYETYNNLIKKIKDKPEELDNIKIFEKEYIDESQTGGTRDSLLMFFIREVYKTYNMCMELMLDKDYGWDDNNLENPYIVIPYSALKTPLSGSKFSSPIINIILTSISYYSKTFRYIDSLKLIKYINMLVKNRLSKEVVCDEKKLDINGIILSLKNDVDGFTKYMINLKKEDESLYYNYIRMYLEEVIFINYVKVDPKIYNCSFIDIIDPNFIENKFALSGTVSVHLPKFEYIEDSRFKLSGINNDDITRQKINIILNGGEGKEKPETLILETLISENLSKEKITDHRNNVPENIGRIINNLDDVNYYMIFSIINLLNDNNVLIDVGSFLRNYENYDFALLVSFVFKDTHILFFDLNDQPIVMRNNVIVNYNMKDLKHDINTKVIFDQKHTIGTDLDLHSMSKGIVTVNSMTTRSELVQGAFRFREINLKQTITFLAKKNGTITTSDEIVEQITNKENQNHENAQAKFYHQNILCLLRKLYDYKKESYDIDTNLPSLEISEKIFDVNGYNYNYTKESFDKFVKNRIEYAPNKDKQPKIIQEINKYLEIIDKLDNIGTELVVQKQSEKKSEVNHEINIEKQIEINQSKRIPDPYDYVRFTVEKIDINVDPTTVKIKIDYGKDYINNDKMYIYYKESEHMCMSLDSGFKLYNLYKNGETNEIFYLYFNEDENLKVQLYTSIDIINLKLSTKEDIIEKLIKLDRFSKEDNNKAFYHNFFMFLLLKIPDNEAIKLFKKNEQIKEIVPIINEHYINFYKYKISGISPEFAKFLGIID